MADVKVNRVNRNFKVKVHLYHNNLSYNTDSDSTPRFYLKPIELLSVEKVGFTDYWSNKNDYIKYGNRFWKWKAEDILTDAQIESMYSDLQNSYPYGFASGDIASTNKYNFDVKSNQAFQSFYKTYWENNQDKVVQPQNFSDETKDYPYPYIEYTVNEIVSYKHVSGAVEALEPGVRTYGQYGSGTSNYYDQPEALACNDETMDVTVFHTGTGLITGSDIADGFVIDSNLRPPLYLSTSGRYRFDLKSGRYGTVNVPWQTGEDGSHPSYRLRFSTGSEGTHNGFTEYTSGVSFVESPEEGHFRVIVTGKTAYTGPGDDAHPYRYLGSLNGYALSGSGTSSTTGINGSGFGYDEGALLTLRRDSTYNFHQTDSSNSGHFMQIATGPSGGIGTGSSVELYTSGVSASSGYLTFTVPYNAPDKLYYTCRNHAYMGGEINIVDAPTAPKTGSVPGESIILDNASVATLTGDMWMYYYSPDKSGIGQFMNFRTGCGTSASFNPL